MLTSPTRLIGWILLLLLPHLAVLYWAFHAGPLTPAEYLKNLYDFGAIDKGSSPLIVLPLFALGIATLWAVFLSKRQSSFSDSVKKSQNQSYFWNRWSLVAWTAFLSLGILGTSCFVCGTGLVGSVAKVLPGVFILLAAFAIGLRLLEFSGVQLQAKQTESSSLSSLSALEKWVLATALGLGFLSLLIFLVGSMGMLSPYFWWPVLTLLTGIGFTPLKRSVLEFKDQFSSLTTRHHPLACATLFVGVVLMVAHLSLLWSSPLDYDVLEYHLGAPAQHFRAGTISFLDENIYANMPGNAEMLFLLPMCLVNDLLTALPAAHVLVMAAWMASIAAVYALSLRLITCTSGGASGSTLNGTGGQATIGTRTVAPAVAALFYMLIPKGSELAADFFVEHFQALFQTGALLAACIFLEKQTGSAPYISDSKWLRVCGLLCGLGCGFKYPVLFFTLIPIVGYLAIFVALRGSIFGVLKCVLWVTVPAAVMFSSWWVRNGIAASDPFFPLGLVMQTRLESHSFIASTPLNHLDLALRPDGYGWSSISKALQSLFLGVTGFSSIVLGLCMGPHLLAWMGAGLVSLRSYCTPARLLVGVIFFWDLLAWIFLTHRVDRFFYPCLAPLAVLGAWGFASAWAEGIPRKIMTLLCVASVVFMAPLGLIVVSQYSSPRAMVGLDSPLESAMQKYHELGHGSVFDAWQAINGLPAESHTLFVGDAQTFYLNHTPTYATVFNTSLLETILEKSTSAENVAHLLNLHGITHVYIHAHEWARLDSSYALKVQTDQHDWQRTELPLKLRHALKDDLVYGRYSAYAQRWPEGIFHGYLHIKPELYRRFEEFIRDYTRVVWTAQGTDRDGKIYVIPGIEVREITVPFSPRIN